jgi:hypothetical protein
MHPAIYSALADARNAELRSAGREPRRWATTQRRRLARVAVAAAVVVAGAIAVSDSGAAVPAAGANSGTVQAVRFDGPTIAQPGQFGWQAQCPADR